MVLPRKLNYLKHFVFQNLLFFVVGCNGQMSEFEKDKSAGINGGFEICKNGLPVNWLMYTPKTVTEGDFKIALDSKLYKEGKQSLRFDVKKCSSTGGRFSPGFTSEFMEFGKFKGEGRYKLSFWVKNKQSTFKISAGGVSINKGNLNKLIEENKDINNWKHLEYFIDIPKNNWLRIELNIIKPGTFWIDAIEIEKQ